MRPCSAIGSAPRFERGGCRFKPCRGLVFSIFRANRLRSPTGRGGGFKPRALQVRILPRPFHERRGVGDRAERLATRGMGSIPTRPALTGSRSPTEEAAVSDTAQCRFESCRDHLPARRVVRLSGSVAQSVEAAARDAVWCGFESRRGHSSSYPKEFSCRQGIPDPEGRSSCGGLAPS